MPTWCDGAHDFKTSLCWDDPADPALGPPLVGCTLNQRPGSVCTGPGSLPIPPPPPLGIPRYAPGTSSRVVLKTVSTNAYMYTPVFSKVYVWWSLMTKFLETGLNKV